MQQNLDLSFATLYKSGGYELDRIINALGLHPASNMLDRLMVIARHKKQLPSIPVKTPRDLRTTYILRKEKLTPAFRTKVWKYRMSDVNEGVCNVCTVHTVTRGNFDTAHIVAETHGGEVIVENMEITCRLCNTSMGTMHLDEFKDRLRFIAHMLSPGFFDDPMEVDNWGFKYV